jgi:hypothetical protein
MKILLRGQRGAESDFMTQVEGYSSEFDLNLRFRKAD